jgi:hypothetical protein
VIGVVSEPFRLGLAFRPASNKGRTTLDNILGNRVPLKAGGTHIANEEVVQRKLKEILRLR